MKSIINLVQTPQGYTIVQNGIEVNKTIAKSKQKSYSLPKKFIQQTFTIYPYIPNLDSHKYLVLPARTLWFNFNSVHELQKKALPEWFKIKKGIMASMNNIKFQKHQELYKKYRNHIIDLGKEKYVTASSARKGLAGDACAIIRIHKFLEKWGLINYIHRKSAKDNQVQTEKAPGQKKDLSKRKDCFDKDKQIASRSYGKDDLELLKKITKKIRPLCHFCEGICGVQWFEYKNKLQLHQFVKRAGKQGKIISKNEGSKDYSMVVCVSCFYDGSYPLILTDSDFTKMTVLDELLGDQALEASDKKRANVENKVAEAIEKNRFRISKAAEQMKLSPEQTLKYLLTMPIQKLQKISRIEAETDTEPEDSEPSQVLKQKPKVQEKYKKQESREKLLLEIFQKEIEMLDHEERQSYDLLVQSWLLKVNAKFQALSEWQQGIKSKFNSIARLERNMLASKMQNLSKRLNTE